MTPRTIAIVDLGRTSYADCWDLQRRLTEERRVGSRGDVLLLTEHDHVYTLGKSANDDHLLANNEELERTGAEVFHIDRGGDITYHGPGQIVGYPILDLRDHREDLHWYLRSLEEVIILTLKRLGIEAGREEGLTGVWVEGEKIAAIGVKVSRWITMHGFALNVSTDLTRFERIIPCGIFHKGVTSVDRILGRPSDPAVIRGYLAESFSTLFGSDALWSTTASVEPSGQHETAVSAYTSEKV